MNKQVFLEKWQVLDPNNQNKVIAFMDVLQHEQSCYQPQTNLGKKLWEIRAK